MVGVGVWLGWDIQKVSGGTSRNVVACKSCSSFFVQVKYYAERADWAL